MAKGITKKQKAFADHYIETGNATQSIYKAGYNVSDYDTARSMASENLTKPNIRQYIEDNASGAMSRIVEMSIKAKNEAVKLGANKDIVDRAGYKPVDKMDVSIGRKSTEKLQDEELNRVMNIFNDNPRENTETEGTD